MLRSYLTIAIRSLLRARYHALINITGLAVGVAFTLLALLYLDHERRFDAFHDRPGDVYLIHEHVPSMGRSRLFTYTPFQVAPMLVEQATRIQAAARVCTISISACAGRRARKTPGS